MQQTESNNLTSQKKSARLCAAEILLESVITPQPIKPVFERHILKAQLAAKDKNLTKELVYGVLRKKEELESALALLSRTPLKKIEPFIYSVLVIGLYQILFLNRIPHSAAVNEAVICCKTYQEKSTAKLTVRGGKFAKRLYGFVNGILRQAVRRKEEVLLHLHQHKNSLFNHPQWMVKRWQQRFGKEETMRICAVNNRPPLLELRINLQKATLSSFTEKLDKANIPWRAGQFAPYAIILPEGGGITKIPGYNENAFQVQDQAAQLCSLLLAPFNQPKLKILDACAGVGGKTGHLLQLALADATIHAVEPEPFRLNRLAQLQKMQQKNSITLQIHQQDLLFFTPRQHFDRILVDAPCSGTGVLRRNPDIRWSRKKADIASLQQKQLALLDHAATLAAPDAVLVYATCSMEKEENEEVVRQFLHLHPEFTLSDPIPFLPESAHRFICNNFFAPHPEEEIDGFFAARLEKRAK